MTNDAIAPDDALDASARCMTAMMTLADYIRDAAAYKLRPNYPLRIAFLDDDSDYLPAALDMMNILMTALTDDEPELACRDLIESIARNDYHPTLYAHFSNTALDLQLPTLPIPDFDYDDDHHCDFPACDLDSNHDR